MENEDSEAKHTLNAELLTHSADGSIPFFLSQLASTRSQALHFRQKTERSFGEWISLRVKT